MKYPFLKSFFIVLISISPFISSGWNSAGHCTAGAITYYYLKANDPAVIPKILQTLTFHPWYNTTWAEQIKKLTGEQRGIALFMLASTFPDDARTTDLGNGEKTMWHYIDYPYVPKGSKKIKGQEPQSPNAQEKILELLDTLGKEKDGAQKALDICWLFHLIEDIHQPLHCTCMVDKNHPDGDKGGNLVYIRIKYGDPQNLHHYWDAASVPMDINYPDKAKQLMQQYPESQLDELKADTDVVGWIKNESVPLAIKYAYLNGKVNGTKDAPVEVPDDYARNTLLVCERRVVLSGIRLAQKLTRIYE